MIYPQSDAIISDPVSLLQNMAANPAACTSIYLDTTQDESKSIFHEENHRQGLARTHKLSDCSVYFFLSHSVSRCCSVPQSEFHSAVPYNCYRALACSGLWREKVAQTDPSGEKPPHYIISDRPMTEEEWIRERCG